MKRKHSPRLTPAVRYALEVGFMLLVAIFFGMLFLQNVSPNPISKDDPLSNGALATLRLSPRLTGMFAEVENEITEQRLAYIYPDGSKEIVPVIWIHAPYRRSVWNLSVAYMMFQNGSGMQTWLRDGMVRYECKNHASGSQKPSQIRFEFRTLPLTKVLASKAPDLTFPELAYTTTQTFNCQSR